MTSPRIHTTAPAKVVLWGEYAVLAGAPAAVLALDRLAHVNIVPTERLSTFTASGFLTGSVQSKDIPDLPITSLLTAILDHAGQDHTDNAKEALGHIRCHLDTRAFYLGNRKIGLGSSAALCVALYHAVCTHTDQTPELADAMAIHRTWQGGSGSGLDVAASWHGGLIKFQAGQVQSIEWPKNLHFEIVFTGHSASTDHQIGKFSDWRTAGDNETLDTLCQCSVELFKQYDHPPAWLEYVTALRALDKAGSLNIFTQDHERLATIASGLNVVYKPCGAGGGDIGIGISDDPSQLTEFRTQAAQAGFTSLQTEIATHGIKARVE